MNKVALGFIPEPLTIPLERILPSRKVPDRVLTSRKFKQIQSSIDAVGLIEPLNIAPKDPGTGKHLLLDGHIRLFALQALGFREAPCLVATDDESYTYNNRINRLSTVQEYFMIRRAVDKGVAPKRIAQVLSVDIDHIVKKMTLLDGICAEAVELLKDQHFSAEITRILRKMKPTRQVECVDLMVSVNNITIAYAKALLVATPAELLVDGMKPQKLGGVTPEQMARMEREMANLQGQYKLVEQTYAEDVLNLVLARGYLAKLLDNAAGARFIKQRQPECLEQFEVIVETTSLDQ